MARPAVRAFVAIACVVFGCVNTTSAQDFVPADWTLIAHYPLTATPNDTTGNNGPMQLIEAPFLNGGLFLNGIGSGSTTGDYSDAATPSIPALNFESFAISTEFNSDSLNSNPVLVGGDSWRWASVWVRDDSLLDFKANDGRNTVSSTATWETDVWHETGFLVDGDTITFYLDDQQAGQITAELETEDDRTVSYSHGGNGVVFYGTVRNLKVYAKTPVQTAIERVDEFPVDGTVAEVYPNPIHRSQVPSIHSTRERTVRISLLDVMGRQVWVEEATTIRAGETLMRGFPTDIAGGIYLLRLDGDGVASTHPVVVVH